MIEIRIHGRGGQGNVVAAYLLASAAFEAGLHCQAFPAFGAERRGAPVVAFVRISDKPILRRNQVLHPSFMIVQDQALLHDASLVAGLKEGGQVLVNSRLDDAGGRDAFKLPSTTIPATDMAREYIGRPLPNVALLSAFLSLTEIAPLKALRTALGDRFSGKILERNLSLIDAAAGKVPTGAWKEAVHATNT